MLARTWPPLDYWLNAEDRMVATAVQLLEEESAQLDRIRGAIDE